MNYTIPSDNIFYTNIGQIISDIFKYSIPIAGILMFLMIIWGGYQIMTSGGNSEGISEGKSKVVMGIVGFFLVFIAWFVVRIVEQIFGIEVF